MSTTSYQLVIAARAILVQNNKLLLVKDKKGTYWYLPGGRVEPEETLRKCAEREVEEETGLKVNILDFFQLFEFFDEKGKIHKIEHWFLGEIKKGKAKAFVIDKDESDPENAVEQTYFFTVKELLERNDIFPQFLKEGEWLGGTKPKNYHRKTAFFPMGVKESFK